MIFYEDPQTYEAATGKNFTPTHPNIRFTGKVLEKQQDLFPKWANIVKYNGRLYWVNENG